MDYMSLEQNVYNIGEHLKNLDAEIADAAVSPAKDATEKVESLQKEKESVTVRFNALKKQLDEAKAKQKAKLRPINKPKNLTEKDKRVNAFAQLIRKTMAKEAVGRDIYEALGDNNNTGGENFLPKTVSANIITAPVEQNPLRDISTVTAISNLEIPRLTFTLGDDGFIQDTQTAKELKAKGDTVQFGRNKFKVEVGLSETVLLGSNANLDQYVTQALRNGVTVKERSVAFNPAPTKDAEKHMSFYDPSVGIQTTNGKDMWTAITNAIADLPEGYRENARVVMTYKDYLSMLRDLANGSATLFSAQPQQIVGKPVVFTDAATTPIVGDFSYSHYNYDPQTIYDRDKDVDTGINKFVVTAWFDHQIKLASAFRLAKVGGSAAAGK